MNPEQKNTNAFSVPAAILLGAIIIAGALVWALHPSSFKPTNPTTAQNQTAPTVDIKDVKTDGEPFVGSATAPVTIAYWFDYQCPFCKQDEETVLPQIVSDYVNAGKVKIVFLDFPFLGPDSDTLSIVARAVWDVDPSNFYKWHKAIFDNQGEEGSGWATSAEIAKITTQVLGANEAAQVQNLITSKATTYENEIQADKTEGNSFGVNGTPAMIIGTQLLIGAEPYSAVKSAIDTALGS